LKVYEGTLVFHRNNDRDDALAHFAGSCLYGGHANANIDTDRFASQRGYGRANPTNSRKRRLGRGCFNGRGRQDAYTYSNPHQH
jgi:hypothetical protein